MIGGFLGFQNAVPASIANGQQASAAIDLKGFTPCTLFMPAAFTGTAITFQVSTAIDGTYEDLYNSSGQVSYTVSQGKAYALDPKDFYGVRFLKIKSGSAEGAARTVTIGVKGF